jgi:hypothetical protein
MAEVSKQLTEHVAPHSVEISRNAKGDYSYSVKVYADDEIAAATRASEAAKHAENLIRRMTEDNAKQAA